MRGPITSSVRRRQTEPSRHSRVRLSKDWHDFRTKPDAIHPKWTDTMRFDFMND